MVNLVTGVDELFASFCYSNQLIGIFKKPLELVEHVGIVGEDTIDLIDETCRFESSGFLGQETSITCRNFEMFPDHVIGDRPTRWGNPRRIKQLCVSFTVEET